MVACSKNENFFKKWSTEMAYVLGFFTADGTMYINPRGSHYFAFSSNDLEMLEKIKILLSSNHTIAKRCIRERCPKPCHSLQIGSRKMYHDLLELGLTSNKSRILQFPKIAPNYLRHFIRGYFDGDGNILFKEYFRHDRNKFKYYFATKFISGSYEFLLTLRQKLKIYAKMGPGSLFKGDRSFVLSYAMKDSRKLCDFMYNGISNNLFLERKYNIFVEAINAMER